LRALLKNPEFSSSPVHIYCDGPRNAADLADIEASRRVVRQLAPKHAVILEREANLGLDKSIISGVSELCERYGRVIVIEDDLEVAPGFLEYMNKALSAYENKPEVMQISGYMYPVSLLAEDSARFLPFTTSWGWATWKRAWYQYDQTAPYFEKLKQSSALRHSFDLHGSYPYFNMLRQNLKKPQPAWDIVFYSNVVAKNGVALHPGKSLVRNNGFDGSGTNCGVYAVDDFSLQETGVRKFPDSTITDAATLHSVERYLRKEGSFFRKVRKRLEALAAG